MKALLLFIFMSNLLSFPLPTNQGGTSSTDAHPFLPSYLLKSSSSISLSSNIAAQSEQHSIVVGSVKRDYLIYLPSSLDKADKLPIILAFHGGKTTPQRLATTSNLQQYAAQGKAIVVFPSGINRGWNDGSGVVNPYVDDLAFVDRLLTDLSRKYPVDQRRIYAAGISNGGFFVQYLACTIPERFAAFATVASTLSQVQADKCEKRSPISILMFNGTFDKFIPWEGGQQLRGANRSLFSVLQTYRFWSALNGCTGFSRSSIQPFRRTLFDRTSVNHFIATGCSPTSAVELFEIVGGGHTWPGGIGQPPLLVGPTTRVIDATPTIWNFFSQHRKPN